MTRQLLKAFNGYAITYHSEYKQNPFVVTLDGKVDQKFGDFHSAMAWVYHQTPNFDEIWTYKNRT
jgi:hypothetical protein